MCANTVSGETQEHRCTLPSEVNVYTCVSQYVQVFQTHPRIFCPSSQFMCPISTFSPVFLLLLLLLEDLLRAGGGDVQESPGCVGVQLLLVTTQRPNIHHPHHLPLLIEGEKCRGSVPKGQYGQGGGLFSTHQSSF